ncbi:hypothetical protein [Rhizobium leguminosarum]|nr:hypothetical protein [Rhizobium leguminosarum]
MNILEQEYTGVRRYGAACRLTYSRYSKELEHGEQSMNILREVN